MTVRARRVAVVDDDPGVLRALHRLLRSANFEVEAFGSGTEFLMAEGGARLDCIVLDLHMPQMNGFEVQERLSQRGGSVPVVVLTGDDTPEARSRSLALGAKGYLSKPIDEGTLLAAIDSVTGPAPDGDRYRS